MYRPERKVALMNMNGKGRVGADLEKRETVQDQIKRKYT